MINLDKMAERLDAEEPQEETPEMTGENRENPETPKPTAEQILPVVSALIGTAGGIVCRIADVPGLKPEEVQSLSEPAAQLLEIYGITLDNPKVMAWVCMAMATAGVAGPRMAVVRQRNAEKKAAAEKPPEVRKPGANPEKDPVLGPDGEPVNPHGQAVNVT